MGVEHGAARRLALGVPKLQKGGQAARPAAALPALGDVHPLHVRGWDARVAALHGLDVQLAGAVHVGLDGVGGGGGGVEGQLVLFVWGWGWGGGGGELVGLGLDWWGWQLVWRGEDGVHVPKKAASHQPPQIQ